MSEDIIEKRAWLVKDLAEISDMSESTIKRRIKELNLEEKGLCESQFLNGVVGAQKYLIISNEGAKQILASLKPKPRTDLNSFDLLRSFVDVLEKQDKKIKALENRMDKKPITNKEKGILTDLKNKIVDNTGYTHRSVWASFKRQFKLSSYHNLEGCMFIEAVNWFNRHLPKKDQHIMIIDILPDDPRQLVFESEFED